MKRIEGLARDFLVGAALCPRTFLGKAAWVTTLLLGTTAMRWALNPVLGEDLPFFLYLPVILLGAAFCGYRTGLAILGGSLFLTVWLWIPPTASWRRIALVDWLSVGIWFLISCVLIVTVALLQKSAAEQRLLVAELNRKSELLAERTDRLEVSEKKLAVHAGNLEQLVAERTATLEEAVADLQSFSYTVSHDLRSPLRAMQGFAQILNDDYAEKLDERGRDYLARIDRAAQRLDGLITDVLSYSSLGRGEIALHPVELDPLLDQIISQYPLLARARERITIERPLGRVVGSESCLVQALSNLLSNAVKFVSPGREPEVKVWAEPFGDLLRLHVADRGIGISPAAQPYIFRPFHRAREAAAYEGTGIGLAIVARALELQHGSVGVSSQPGQGSDFWIELPRVPQKGGTSS